MTTVRDGGPAFPVGFNNGLSTRDYFAAKALQGLLADTGAGCTCEQFAEWSYKYADAMLKAREE